MTPEEPWHHNQRWLWLGRWVCIGFSLAAMLSVTAAIFSRGFLVASDWISAALLPGILLAAVFSFLIFSFEYAIERRTPTQVPGEDLERWFRRIGIPLAGFVAISIVVLIGIPLGSASMLSQKLTIETTAQKSICTWGGYRNSSGPSECVELAGYFNPLRSSFGIHLSWDNSPLLVRMTATGSEIGVYVESLQVR